MIERGCHKWVFVLARLIILFRAACLGSCLPSADTVKILAGKSTLLNHLFGTRFVEMDALRGR
jgi:hypothetical protein